MKSKALSSFPILRYAKAAVYAALTSTAIVGIQASANENPYTSEDLYFSTEESCNSFQGDKMKASYISPDEVTDAIRADALNNFGITIPPKPQEPDFGIDNPYTKILQSKGWDDGPSDSKSLSDINYLFERIYSMRGGYSYGDNLAKRGQHQYTYLKGYSEGYHHHSIYSPLKYIVNNQYNFSEDIVYIPSTSELQPTINDIRYLRILDYLSVYDAFKDYDSYYYSSKYSEAQLIVEMDRAYPHEVREDRLAWLHYQDLYNDYYTMLMRYNILKYELPAINNALTHWHEYGQENYEYQIRRFKLSDLLVTPTWTSVQDYLREHKLNYFSERIATCNSLVGFASIHDEEQFRLEQGLVYGPTDPGLIDALSCNLNDGKCFITVNGLSVNGKTHEVGPYFCRSKTMAFDQQAFANGSDMLNMLLMTYASGLKASFRLSADCTGEYPTLNHIELFRGS